MRENESSIAKEIQWRYFPGYNRLLRGYFVEMKTRDILEYPESMIEAGKRLMANENLLNTFVSILFNQANIYRPLTVIKALDFISRVLG